MNLTPEQINATPCRICGKPIAGEAYYVEADSSDRPAGHAACIDKQWMDRTYGVDPAAPSQKVLLATLDAMERYGGGFVQALAIAWRKADPTNSRRLREVFGDYFARYKALAEEDAARAAGKVTQ